MTLFNKSLKTKVIDRIDVLYDAAKYLVIEENYIEPEWKTMIAKHYINSAYSSTLKQSVIRVHFLSKNEFSQQSYLGFITLRPLEELEIALSFVYLNWKHALFSNCTTFVMTYPKEVNYMGESITIHTYPFFAQDSIVACCADANVIMLKKYFANKFNISTTGKNSFPISKTSKEHKLPKKVDSMLLKAMLSDAEIPFRIQRFRNMGKNDKTKWERIQKNINAYIESGLPVILGVDGHVIQLIGQINLTKDIATHYIVYDDSGHLEKICSGYSQDNKRHFTYILGIEDIKKYFEREENNSFFLLFSEHERVYIDFERYEFFLTEYLLQLYGLDKEKKSILSWIFNIDGKVNPDVSFRTMLVDNSVLKSFFLKHKKSNQEKTINDFIKRGFPHYLWYTEITVKEKIFCVCADPTMYYNTRDIEKLFLDMGPIGLVDNERLLLLTKSEQQI